MIKNFLKFLTLSCFIFFPLSCSKQRVVAQVGKISIREDQTDLRLKMTKILNPAATPDMVLNQLIHSARLSIVLDGAGIITTDSEINTAFEQLKQKASKSEPLANLIKKFGGHKEFKNLYVKPTVISEKIFSEAYAKDEAFQSEPLKKLEKILSGSISDPAQLEELSNKEQALIVKGTVDTRGSGLIWASDRKVASTHSLPSGIGVARKWHRDFLKDTGEGRMVNRVESLGNHFLVIRREVPNQKEPNLIPLTIATLPKRSFSDWLKEKTAPIKVQRFSLD